MQLTVTHQTHPGTAHHVWLCQHYQWHCEQGWATTAALLQSRAARIPVLQQHWTVVHQGGLSLPLCQGHWSGPILLEPVADDCTVRVLVWLFVRTLRPQATAGMVPSAVTQRETKQSQRVCLLLYHINSMKLEYKCMHHTCYYMQKPGNDPG